MSRFALSVCVVAITVAACGGTQPAITVPGAFPQTPASQAHVERDGSRMSPEARNGALLYVSSFSFGGGSDTSVYTYPGGRPVGDLGTVDARGLCSDAAGNVFIVETNAEEIVEYAHGGTQPIATLDDQYNSPNGCAVDPTTGNLAVAGGNFPGYYVSANVAIFPQAMGSPTVYYDDSDLTFSWCTYDDQGNLFANGRNFKKGESNLVELPVGGSTFSQITLQNANVHGNGSIQWDGHYLAIAKRYDGEHKKEPATIYQLQISGQSAKVANTIELQGSHVSDPNGWITQQFWIHNHRIISPESTDNRVGLWDYPSGGYPTRSKVRTPYVPYGLTLSVGPGHL